VSWQQISKSARNDVLQTISFRFEELLYDHFPDYGREDFDSTNSYKGYAYRMMARDIVLAEFKAMIANLKELT